MAFLLVEDDDIEVDDDDVGGRQLAVGSRQSAVGSRRSAVSGRRASSSSIFRRCIADLFLSSRSSEFLLSRYPPRGVFRAPGASKADPGMRNGEAPSPPYVKHINNLLFQ